MITAVLDTNVLAARLHPPQAHSLRSWISGETADFGLSSRQKFLPSLIACLTSPTSANESPLNSASIFWLFLPEGRNSYRLTATVVGVASHPEDDRVLATALSAPPGYIVTGDRELRRLRSFEGIRIVNPSEFLEVLAGFERGIGEDALLPLVNLPAQCYRAHGAFPRISDGVNDDDDVI